MATTTEIDKETNENKHGLAPMDLKQYAEANIKATKCIRFVQKKDEDKCCCGRGKGDHKDHKGTREGDWDKVQDLEQITTTAYGEMKLSGFPVFAGTKIKYVRASHTETLCADLYHIMTKIWNFNKPDLIISINGGCKKMIPLTNKQKSAFKSGLINVSNTASTWIITGGFYCGVAKLVGEAAMDNKIESQKKNIIVLGIGTWGAVHNRQDLLIKEEGKEITYRNEVDFKKGQAPLDPNHDAFILFDSGTEGEFGMELEFRAKFEMFASNEAKCSVVQVLVEGGKKCIITANEALMQGIPVVVMKGSKRAADLICDTFESDENLKLGIINEALQKYKLEWSITTDEEIKLRNCLLSLFKQKNLIHIFSMSDFNTNLDRAILKAAFSGKIDGHEMTDKEMLKMAMTFNRHDVAEEYENIKDLWTVYDDNVILLALKKDQWNFIKLFLARGKKFESYLIKIYLQRLYSDDVMKEHVNPKVFSIIRMLINQLGRLKQDRILIIGLVVKSLTKNLIMNMYTGKKKSTENSSSTDVNLENLYKNDRVSHNSCTSIDNGSRGIYEYEDRTSRKKSEVRRQKANETKYTEQDLFIWALLTQRWEMAKIFWERGKDHIGSALIASVICKSLSKTAMKEGELDMADTLQSRQREYETLAISVLTEAYDRDKKWTHLLLIRALPNWGEVTCMEIANKGQLINFLSQSACQTRLNHIWRGGMSNVGIPLLLLNLPFAFLSSKMLIFRHTRKYEVLKENIESPNSPIEGDYLRSFRNKQDIAVQNVSYRRAVSIYYKAPIIKFTMHVISYLLFLTIFSYTLLVELIPLSAVSSIAQRQMEYAVYAYILSFVFEEMRQAIVGSQIDTFKERFYDWITNLWNVYDIILYIFFIIAVILRHITSIDFVYSRTIFSVTLSMFFIRFLQFYYANRSLGPKVILVSRMIKDIAFFLALYVIAIFAYGTFAQALLFSNSPINGFLLKNIVYMPYWQSYGDLRVEYVEGTTPLNNVNASPNAFVIVAFALYMLFTNALLMNMLVAMFGITFQKVEENSNRIWAFNRYQLIEEFYYRPIMPPPLNIFEIIRMMICAPKLKTIEKEKPRRDDFVVNLNNDENIRSAGFERLCFEKIPLEKLDANAEQSPSSRV